MEPLDFLDLLRVVLNLGATVLRLGYETGGARNAIRRIGSAPRRAPAVERAGEPAPPLVIDPRLLDDLVRAVDGVQQRYRRALRRAETPAARRVADLCAEQEIYEHLSRIRRRNGGTLPHEALRTAWRSYHCDDRAVRHRLLLPEATPTGPG